MDRICEQCGEPWDVYHVTHDEGILEGHDTSKAVEHVEKKGFSLFLPLLSVEEAYEGHFVILECPACTE